MSHNLVERSAARKQTGNASGGGNQLNLCAEAKRAYGVPNAAQYIMASE